MLSEFSSKVTNVNYSPESLKRPWGCCHRPLARNSSKRATFRQTSGAGPKCKYAWTFQLLKKELNTREQAAAICLEASGCGEFSSLTHAASEFKAIVMTACKLAKVISIPCKCLAPAGVQDDTSTEPVRVETLPLMSGSMTSSILLESPRRISRARRPGVPDSLRAQSL